MNVRLPLPLGLALCLALFSLTACSKETPEDDPTAKPPVPPPPGAKAELDPSAPLDFTGTEAAPETAGSPDDLAVPPRQGEGPAQARPPQRRNQEVEIQANLLNVAVLLERAELREATGYQGLIEEVDLPGQKASARYNGVRWRVDDANDLGISLQVWKPGNQPAATKRFDDLFSQSFGGTKSRDAGDDAFRTEHHGLRSLTFIDRRRSAVANLSCTASICTFDQLADLARRVQRRL